MFRWSGRVDGVILVTSRTPEEAVYQELRRRPEALKQNGVEAVYRIGDCLAPRLYVADAIFDGHRLGREIDTANPAVAASLPHASVPAWTHCPRQTTTNSAR